MLNISKKNLVKEVKEKALQRVPAFANKVAPLYVLLQWRWYDPDTRSLRVPTVKEIYERLESDLKDERFLGGVGAMVSHGGLQVAIEENNGVPDVVFSFIVKDTIYGCEVLEK